MLTAASFTPAKTWRQPGCPQTEEQRNTVGSIHTKEYYPALERKDILTYATRIDPEDSALSAMSTSQEDETCVTPRV